MIGTEPERGSIIRYAYLWADESARGHEEGRKNRPALVLALSIKEADGTTEVLVLAVTHTPPVHPADAVAFPPHVRPVPGRTPRAVIYGKVPDALLQQVARSYLANREKQRSRLVPRTE